MTDHTRQRLNFDSGGLLTAADFTLEQTYHLQSQALRCSALNSWGVAWGLEVTVRPNGQSISVAPGMAVDGGGRQILVSKAMTLDLSGQVAPTVYVSLGLKSEYVDYRMFPSGAGYCRIDDAPVLSVSPYPPLMDGWAVPLCSLTFTPERRLRDPDLSDRRFTGLKVGEVTMTPPAGGGAAATMALDAAGTTLVVRSPLTDVFGALSVHGAVAVGELGSADVALSLQPGAPQGSAGTVSSAPLASGTGAVLFGSGAYQLSSAVAGDRILAPAPISDLGEVDTTAAQTMTVISVTGQTATVSAAPAAALDQAPYAIERGTILRVRSDPLTTALQISIDGQVGVGGAPAPVGGALLTVRAGDLLIDGPHDLRFLQDGSVKAVAANGAALHEIDFLASQNTLAVKEAGEIVFDSGGGAIGGGPPGLMLAINQNVGVGVATPPYRLSVDGEVRLSQGVIFPDGTEQTQGVSAIPVGTIVNWWNGNQQLSWQGTGFQLCNGSTITDPESPLVGTKTPDLRGVYVRGAVSYDQIGAAGGSASHTHAYTLGDHNHRLDHTHKVNGYTTSVIGTAGQNIAGSSVSTDHHMHVINVTSGNASPNTTGAASQTKPENTDPAPNQPPYMMLIKAMRIK
jgi:hypothetical protein